MQGRTDIPLNDTGRQQAREVAQRLLEEGEIWSGIVSSTLARAHETAQIIADALGIPLLGSYEDLVERGYGDMEGMDVDEARARFWVDEDFDVDGLELRADFDARALAGVDAAAAAHPVDGLLIATHGTFARHFADAITGHATGRLNNGDSVHFEGEPGAWRATKLIENAAVSR